jgi:hypothetical protein
MYSVTDIIPTFRHLSCALKLFHDSKWSFSVFCFLSCKGSMMKLKMVPSPSVKSHLATLISGWLKTQVTFFLSLKTAFPSLLWYTYRPITPWIWLSWKILSGYKAAKNILSGFKQTRPEVISYGNYDT